MPILTDFLRSLETYKPYEIFANCFSVLKVIGVSKATDSAYNPSYRIFSLFRKKILGAI